jgi:hypothetical protein
MPDSLTRQILNEHLLESASALTVARGVGVESEWSSRQL